MCVGGTCAGMRAFAARWRHRRPLRAHSLPKLSRRAQTRLSNIYIYREIAILSCDCHIKYLVIYLVGSRLAALFVVCI